MKHKESDVLKSKWQKKEGPIVFTTVDTQGIPNSIYATCTQMSDDGKIVIADNYFNKTKQNISPECHAVVLFITSDGQAIQVKGTLDYETSGPYFDFMKSWNPEQHPGHAAAVLSVHHIYSGSEELE